MKKALILLTILSLFACGSKKVTTKEQLIQAREKIDSLEQLKSKVKIDTITKFKDRVIVDMIETEIEVPINCDSLGRVKNFRYNSGSGPARTTVTLQNNKLVIETAVDSIIQVYEKEYQSRYEKDSLALLQKIKEEFSSVSKTDKEVVKTRWPWWLYVIIILGVALIGVVIYFGLSGARLFSVGGRPFS